jgi:hypothetical protein
VLRRKRESRAGGKSHADLHAKDDLLGSIMDGFSPFSRNPQRFAAMTPRMESDPIVARIEWMLKTEDGWAHVNDGLSGTPAELIKTQARVFQHNFIERWEPQFPSLAAQVVVYEGFVRTAVAGWTVGFAEMDQQWERERPCTVQMNELADGASATCEQLDERALSDAAWYGLDMLRGLSIYQYLFRPLDLSAVDVLTAPWGPEGLQAGGRMLDWGYSLLLAQRELESGPA